MDDQSNIVKMIPRQKTVHGNFLTPTELDKTENELLYNICLAAFRDKRLPPHDFDIESMAVNIVEHTTKEERAAFLNSVTDALTPLLDATTKRIEEQT